MIAFEADCIAICPNPPQPVAGDMEEFPWLSRFTDFRASLLFCFWLPCLWVVHHQICQPIWLGDFDATVKDRRAVKVVLVDWEPRADVHSFCRRHAGGAVKGLPGGRFYGCVVINPDNGRCLVVTDVKTSYSILGHEVRHCFENNFH